MREELDALIGAGWGESSPIRKGYRNGSYTREPFDHFWSDRRPQGTTRPRRPVPHPGRMTRYRRYEPHVAQGLTEMFVAGTSTRHPSGKWPKPCWEWHPVPVPTAGSTGMLTQQYETLRQCPRPRPLAQVLSGCGAFQHSPWGVDRFHHQLDRRASG